MYTIHRYHLVLDHGLLFKGGVSHAERPERARRAGRKFSLVALSRSLRHVRDQLSRRLGLSCLNQALEGLSLAVNTSSKFYLSSSVLKCKWKSTGGLRRARLSPAARIGVCSILGA